MKICADMLFPAVVLVPLLVACSACSDRYFLNENKECAACPEHCLFCDSNERCLSCENGYWGNICERPCTYCMTGTGCEKTNGVCQNECIYGYSGILCNIKCESKCLYCNREHSAICVKCAPGRYPVVSCNETCSGCYGQTCDEAGVCSERCVNGSWGQTCTRTCPQHCKYASCDRDNGTCIFGCNDDFMGLQCNGTRTDSSVNDTNSTLVIPLVVVITLIVLAGALIALFVLCRKRIVFSMRSLRETFSTRKRSRQGFVPKVDLEESTTLTGEERKIDNVKVGESTNKYKNKRMPTKASDSKLQPKPGRQQLQEFVDRVRTLSDEDYRRYFLRLTDSVSLTEISTNRENNSDSPGVDERVLSKETVTVEIGDTKEEFKNARFIQGKECNTPEYIAYKGPTGQTSEISRFWRMILELDCKRIVMLGTLSEVKKEIQQYWPNKGDFVSYGRLFIKQREVNANESVQYVTRTIEIKKGPQVTSVTQLQFRGRSEKRFVEVVQNLLEFREEGKKAKKGRGPTVVHGRTDQTGTFIALDMLLNEVDDMVNSMNAKELDIFACVDNLQRQGISVVENDEQYKCLYHVVSHYIEEKLRDKNENKCGGSNTHAEGNSEKKELVTDIY